MLLLSKKGCIIAREPDAASIDATSCYGRSVWYSRKPSAGLSQDIASDIHVWSVGGASAGASKLLMVTEISFGQASCLYVNGVPHFGQNVRATHADERYSVGDSAVNLNPSLDTVTH